MESSKALLVAVVGWYGVGGERKEIVEISKACQSTPFPNSLISEFCTEHRTWATCHHLQFLCVCTCILPWCVCVHVQVGGSSQKPDGQTVHRDRSRFCFWAHFCHCAKQILLTWNVSNQLSLTESQGNKRHAGRSKKGRETLSSQTRRMRMK